MALPGVPAVTAGEGSAVEIRETLAPDTCTQVRIELKAEGLFRPGLPPGAMSAEARLPKPLSLDVKSRLFYTERILGPRPPVSAKSEKRPPA